MNNLINLFSNKKYLGDWFNTKTKSNWHFDDNLLVTFVTLSALKELNPNILDGKILSKILIYLTKHEIQVGGPYYSKPTDKKIDLDANIAIAYFLFLNDVELPNLTNLIKTEFSKSNCSPLALYLTAKFFNKEKSDSGLLKNKDEKLIFNKIIQSAKFRFKNLPKEFRQIALAEIKRTISNNKDKQMSLISYYFRLSLGEAGKKISDAFVAEAGLANIFFWTAFIIYDDFWDEDERATPSILPTANIFARHYINFYLMIAQEQPDFRLFFHDLMDKLDAANTWETLHCRTKVIDSKFIIPDKLPNYKDYTLKFQPASGQVLGPIAILLKLGFRLDSKEVKGLITYFKNYLIAMQINDDAHDLLEDLGRGHLSTVVVMFIYDWLEKYPDSKEIHLINDLEKIQKLFWFKTIKTSSLTALDFTRKSRGALEKLSFLTNQKPLAHFINITENIAKTALEEQRKSLDLLEEFR